MSWRDKAKCAGLPPELFFPNESGRGGRTKKGERPKNADTAQEDVSVICTGALDGIPCPVIVPCLEYALDNKMEGVWGGTSEAERMRIKRRRRVERQRAAAREIEAQAG